MCVPVTHDGFAFIAFSIQWSVGLSRLTGFLRGFMQEPTTMFRCRRSVRTFQREDQTLQGHEECVMFFSLFVPFGCYGVCGEKGTRT